jgi:hypothetical protein
MFYIDDQSAFLGVAAGFTVPAAAVLLTAGGVLLGVGAQKVAPSEAAARAGDAKRELAPAVRLGPGSGSVTWRF